MERVLYYILIVLGAIVVSIGWVGGIHYFFCGVIDAWIDRNEEKRRLEREVAYLSERLTSLEEKGGCRCHANDGTDADGDLKRVPEYDLGEQGEADGR